MVTVIGKLLHPEDLEVALEETLANGHCDISIYLASNAHAQQVRDQFLKHIPDNTEEAIEILTFAWGFRLMRLRPVRPLSEL